MTFGMEFQICIHKISDNYVFSQIKSTVVYIYKQSHDVHSGSFDTISAPS